MSLLQEWREEAYSQDMNKKEGQLYWGKYFAVEKGIYEKLLAAPGEVVTGTVKELAEKYGTSIRIITGFLDGINDSLVKPNPIEEMTEESGI